MGRRAQGTASAKGFVYSDARVDDARLGRASTRLRRASSAPTSACARGSRRRAPRRTACGARRWSTARDGAEDVARALVNAAGPWVKERARPASARTRVAPERAARQGQPHRRAARACREPHAYILQNSDKRIVFVIPYQNELFADRDDRRPGRRLRDAADLAPTRSTTCARSPTPISARPIAAADIVWTYSGVRPLYDDGSGRPVGDHARLRAQARRATIGATRAAAVGLRRQDHDLSQARRARARPSCAVLSANAGLAWTDRQPLPGGDLPARRARCVRARARRALSGDCPRSLLAALAHRHGTRAPRVLGDARRPGRSGRALRAHALRRAKSIISSRRNGRRNADDVLWRRTKCGLAFDAEAARRGRRACVNSAARGDGSLSAVMRPLVAMPDAARARDPRRADRHRRHAVDARQHHRAKRTRAMERLRARGLLVIPITGRPAGWCDHIARMWPVDAVVGENGALYMLSRSSGAQAAQALRRDRGRARRRIAQRLAAIATSASCARCPGCALASDQRVSRKPISRSTSAKTCRGCRDDAVDRIVALMRADGHDRQGELDSRQRLVRRRMTSCR